MKMNKMLGFYELPKIGLPCIPWRKFEKDIELDPLLLWTVRTAVLEGNDFNLPRKVGVEAKEAYDFAAEQEARLKEKGLVVTYPYFIAIKSGTLEVSANRVVIEAVYEDLWNLVTNNDKDVTVIAVDGDIVIEGEDDFFDDDELKELIQQSMKIRGKFRDALNQGNSVLLEWSFAYNTNKDKERIGEKYLVFYEVREI